MSRLKIWILVTIGILSLAACSTSNVVNPEPNVPDTPTNIPEPTSPPEPTEEPAKKELPSSTTFAVLGAEANTKYKVEMGTFQKLEFEDSELPAPPSSVEAHWFSSAGRYVVAYLGLDLSQAGPLCPGNSISTSEGFKFVSNSPTEDGACQGFTTVSTDPDVGPLICQDTVFYITAIPSGTEGILYGTLEKLADDGANMVGLTSRADTSSGVPEIDLNDYCD